MAKPPDMVLVPGNQPSVNTKIAERKTALANSGMDVVKIEDTEIKRSRSEPSRIPAKTPRNNDKGTIIAIATPPNIAPFTIIMLQLNWLLSGVVVTEFAFAYKGFGALLLEASLNKDIFLIEACSMVAVFVAVFSQLLSDIGYTFLNPRIRFN